MLNISVAMDSRIAREPPHEKARIKLHPQPPLQILLELWVSLPRWPITWVLAYLGVAPNSLVCLLNTLPGTTLGLTGSVMLQTAQSTVSLPRSLVIDYQNCDLLQANR